MAIARRTPAQVVDYLVVGGGIIGVSTALELQRRRPRARIMVLEKERSVAMHGSGRNSGVLHSGFYYGTDSLKAKFSRQGNQYLSWYCKHKQIPINPCGKLVVAQGEQFLPGLEKLYHQGVANGVPVELLSAHQVDKIEPLARTTKAALWSPSTAVSDCTLVTAAVAEDGRKLGVNYSFNSQYATVKRTGHVAATVQSDDGFKHFEASHLVNCAGLYADQVAKPLGFAQGLEMLPLKGLYMYCNVPLKTLLYPVPDPSKNVLGVHYTLTVDGKVKIGPTATPAFWRENYSGLSNLNLAELFQVTSLEAKLWFKSSFGFRDQAVEEMKKYYKPHMVAAAKSLVKHAEDSQFTHYSRPGIRAQLVDVNQRSLVMDFCVQGDALSTHVLNAVSPAWTCSNPMAAFLCDRILQ